MLNFHAPTARDYEWIQPILYKAGLPGADNTFQSMYFWDGYYGEVGLAEGFVTQYLRQDGAEIYLYPAGAGDESPALEAVLQDARERGGQLRLRGVTPDKRETLERLFPGKFEFTSYRDSFDYIYTVEELAELHGKKLQAKRNHCNRFEAEHPDFKTQRVTPETIPLCREMTEKWYEAHAWNEKIEYEKIAIARAFDCFSETGMDGLLLVENGEVLAFSLGARMNERYYDVCFEKAFSAINGAYAMINREFSRMIAEKYPAVAYLNREDDMGEPGLRKAKESYQPTLLLEKFTADWKEKI